MTTTTIRVPQQTRETLRAMSRSTGYSMQEVLEQALELYRRQQLLEATNAAYAALHSDADAWNDLAAERADWDGTLADGLEDL